MPALALSSFPTLLGIPSPVLAAGTGAQALPLDTGSGLIRCLSVNGGMQIDVRRAEVTGASGGSTDPLIGSWQTLTSPAMPNNSTYVLVAQTVPGTWTLSNTSSDLYLLLKPNSDTTDSLLSGMTAP
jgi:hypothetical protein